MPYVVRRAKVSQSLNLLRSSRVHRQFVGYLCIRRTAAAARVIVRLRVNFQEFFGTFLRVAGSPKDRPYMIVFSEEPPSEHNRWFNRNVAGSYAPSSLRPEAPLHRVIEVEGRRTATRYSLRPAHPRLAREHLAYGRPVPAVALSVVLYRDYGFEAPRLRDVVTAFGHEFGYAPIRGGSFTHEFDQLYVAEEDLENGGDEWFEEIGT